jgi:hypothetical protein
MQGMLHFSFLFLFLRKWSAHIIWILSEYLQLDRESHD